MQLAIMLSVVKLCDPSRDLSYSQNQDSLAATYICTALTLGVGAKHAFHLDPPKMFLSYTRSEHKNTPNRFSIHQITAPILVAISQMSLLSKRVMSYAKVIKKKE
jgi:hypothetical protein